MPDGVPPNPEKKIPFPRPSRLCPVCKQDQEHEVERTQTRKFGILMYGKSTITFQQRVWVCDHCKDVGDQGLGYMNDNHPYSDDIQDRFGELQYRQACQDALNALTGLDLKSMREWAGLTHDRMGRLLNINPIRLEEAEIKGTPLFQGPHPLLNESAKHLIAMEAVHPGTFRHAIEVITFHAESDTFCVDLYEKKD